MRIDSHGPIITATDYWESDAAAAGRVILSPNAGVIRCLLPPSLYEVVGDLRSAKYAIVTVGPWSRQAARGFGLALPLADGADCVEILWEDHTQSPHVWHLDGNSCLMVPGDPSPGAWAIALWVERRGRPHKALERPAHWRRGAVPKMGPWVNHGDE